MGDIANIRNYIIYRLVWQYIILTAVAKFIPAIKNILCHLQVIDNQYPKYEPLTL